MIEEGWITVDYLQNPEFGGGAISARVYHESFRLPGRSYLRAVDRDGRGIDAGIFHSNFIATPEVFNFDRLNLLCQTQIAKDVTAEQIAAFIEFYRVTVANLIDCSQSNEVVENADPYFMSLLEIARKKAAGKLLSHRVNVELSAIRTKFNVKQKAVEQDFKRAEQQVGSPVDQARLGMLSAEDAAIVEPLRNYVRDFAFLNTGGRGVVMNLTQPDLSKAIMGRDDFEFLYRKDWIEVAADDGSTCTIFPAKCFLTKPPKNAQSYHGGLVFKPSGTVAADEYNLYGGMLVKPDESGSCSMLRELIRDVWAQGNEETTQWVMEWLMHIIAHPGERVGTSIAIRGGYGDGKSIVFEKLIGTIVGDMMLRVANHKMILGDFNEALIGKLVTVLEEAAFAGDKPAFDKMKELITGEKALINPKFKAPITVDNFSRLVVVSNHDHFLHIKPGDRRYTVLESSAAWQGTKKFEQLLDQWANGGAARFVHEAMNLSFRRLPDEKKLVIATNLKTTAAVRQMALSRSSLEKCIVDIILRGDFTTQRGSDVHVFESGGFGTLKPWKLDRTLEIPSLDLERFVRSWLSHFDSSAGRHGATLHTIIETLRRYIGDTGIFRPKGIADAATRKRPQQATRRLLPTRRKALEHAWSVGLITDEEYDLAFPVTTASNAGFRLPIEDSSEFELPVGLTAANDHLEIAVGCNFSASANGGG